MAKGKKAQQAANRRAHLDNEVMQEMKEENRNLRKELENARQEINQVKVQHESEYAEEVKRRTEEALLDAQQRIELAEDSARAYVQGHAEAFSTYMIATYKQIPNPTGSGNSDQAFVDVLAGSGIEDYDKFIYTLVKAIDPKNNWNRNGSRNLRKHRLVRAYWDEMNKISKGFDPKVRDAMKAVAERNE